MHASNLIGAIRAGIETGVGGNVDGAIGGQQCHLQNRAAVVNERTQSHGAGLKRQRDGQWLIARLMWHPAGTAK